MSKVDTDRINLCLKFLSPGGEIPPPKASETFFAVIHPSPPAPRSSALYFFAYCPSSRRCERLSGVAIHHAPRPSDRRALAIPHRAFHTSTGGVRARSRAHMQTASSSPPCGTMAPRGDYRDSLRPCHPSLRGGHSQLNGILASGDDGKPEGSDEEVPVLVGD